MAHGTELAKRRNALLDREKALAFDGEIERGPTFNPLDAANAGNPSLVLAAGEKPDFHLPGKVNLLQIVPNDFEGMVRGVEQWGRVFTMVSRAYGSPVQAIMAKKWKEGSTLEKLELGQSLEVSEDNRETLVVWQFDHDLQAIAEVEYFVDESKKELPEGIKFLTTSKQEEIANGAHFLTLTEEAQSVMERVKSLNIIYVPQANQPNVFEKRDEGKLAVEEAERLLAEDRENKAAVTEAERIINEHANSNKSQDAQEDESVVKARMQWILKGPQKP